MAPAEAQRLRLADTDAFRRYMQDVWQSTESFLETAGTAALDAPVLVRPLGEMPAAQALGQVCASHGFGHYGEIELCRTLMGLPTAGDLKASRVFRGRPRRLSAWRWHIVRSAQHQVALTEDLRARSLPGAARRAALLGSTFGRTQLPSTETTPSPFGLARHR